MGKRLFSFFDPLTNDDRESVLIVDDSTYDRSRSKRVELLYRVWDHSTGRYLKGFRMLTMFLKKALGWSSALVHLQDQQRHFGRVQQPGSSG
jgi:hypothetical protein